MLLKEMLIIAFYRLEAIYGEDGKKQVEKMFLCRMCVMRKYG